MGSFFSRDNQAQARAELEERLKLDAGVFKGVATEVAKQGFLGGLFGAAQKLIPGTGKNQTQRSFEPYGAREFSEEERRAFLSGAIPSLLGTLKNDKSLANNILGGIASAVGITAIGSLFNHQNSSK